MQETQAAPRTRAGPATRSDGWLALALAGVLLLALRQALALARAEWFSRDDFAFLLYVQRAFDWPGALLPLERGFWWAWRPIGMDGFFRMSFELFGLEPFGYFAVALAVHLALAPATWWLARGVSLAPPAALTAGALAVVLPPCFSGFAYASVFHYLAANLLGTLALGCFLRGRRRGAWLPRVASAACFSAALLCNESALVLLGVAFLLALPDADGASLGARSAQALRAVAFLLVPAAGYALLRLAIVELADPPAAYQVRLGNNVLRHFWMQPRYLAGSDARLAGALGLMLAALCACVASRAADPAPLRGLLRAYAWLWPWLFAAIAVFATLPFSHARFAMTLQVPGALLVGVHLDALWRCFGTRSPSALRAACVLLVLLAVPFAALRERTLEPRGRVARELVEGVARAHPRPPPGSSLVLLYGGDALASPRQVEQLRLLTYGGTAIRARFPQLAALRFVNASQADAAACTGCLYVALDRELRVRALPAGSAREQSRKRDEP